MHSVGFLSEQFKNLILVELSKNLIIVGYNPIASLDGLQRLSYLRSVSLTGCQLKILPESLLSVRTLE